MNERSLREQVIESQEFAFAAGDLMRERITDLQAAMIAYYIINRKDDELGAFVRESFVVPMVALLNSMTEETK